MSSSSNASNGSGGETQKGLASHFSFLPVKRGAVEEFLSAGSRFR